MDKLSSGTQAGAADEFAAVRPCWVPFPGPFVSTPPHDPFVSVSHDWQMMAALEERRKAEAVAGVPEAVLEVDSVYTGACPPGYELAMLKSVSSAKCKRIGSVLIGPAADEVRE